ncbi:MAG: hypothetical protein FJW66_03520 [Actinobacteria bacterium]|nr:hypothetical protein [Actinomycetota bacterium]
MPDLHIPENQPASHDREGSCNYPELERSVSGRIAVYDNLRSIPRIIDFDYETISFFLDEVPQKVYSISHSLGGKIPYTILKEVIENLIHADFQDIIITIMDEGNHIIISDQGPGVSDKDKAFLPGYTSATSSMKKYIRGVGSGLPIVKETIVFSGGSIDIGNNIKKGTVVSLRIGDLPVNGIKISAPDGSGLSLSKDPSIVLAEDQKNEISLKIGPSTKMHKVISETENPESLNLSIRQKKILSLMLELDEMGPARIAKELGFSLSTSYRELIFLENLKLLTLTDSGKRRLTPKGKKYLEYYSNSF